MRNQQLLKDFAPLSQFSYSMSLEPTICTNYITTKQITQHNELVSGFNVEYCCSGFALILLAEYASILFMSLLFCVIFLGSDLYSFLFYFKLPFISFLFVWVRGTLPRLRYDKLMYLAWRRFLPLSLNYLLLFVFVMCFIFLCYIVLIQVL